MLLWCQPRLRVAASNGGLACWKHWRREVAVLWCIVSTAAWEDGMRMHCAKKSAWQHFFLHTFGPGRFLDGCVSHKSKGVDEVRLQWPGYRSCCLQQLVRMLFDHRICLLDYEKTRERGVHYNPQQRLPDQTTILRGVVSLHLHDTRKPLPNEDVSRPHEKPSDPYWEGH